MLAVDTEFCPVLNDLLRTRSAVGRTGKVFNDIESLSTRNNLLFLRNAMLDLKPKRTLEIGLAFGASTLVFCTEHQRLGHNAEKQHVAIDPYQPYSPYDEAGVVNVEKAGLTGYLDYRGEFSEFVLPRLLETSQRFDFIYVDGSHLFESVLIDAFYCARLLNDGGIIAFDDCTDPHVAKVIAFTRTNLSGQLREMPASFYGRTDLRFRVGHLINRNQLTAFVRLPYIGSQNYRKWDTPLREWDSKLGRF